MMDEPFKKQTISVGKSTSVILVCELNEAHLRHMGELQESLKAQIKLGNSRILMNFKNVLSLRSEVLTVLLRLLAVIYEYEGQLKFSQLSPEVFRQLQSLRLEKIFDIYSSDAKALQAFGSD